MPEENGEHNTENCTDVAAVDNGGDQVGEPGVQKADDGHLKEGELIHANEASSGADHHENNEGPAEVTEVPESAGGDHVNDQSLPEKAQIQENGKVPEKDFEETAKDVVKQNSANSPKPKHINLGGSGDASRTANNENSAIKQNIDPQTVKEIKRTHHKAKGPGKQGLKKIKKGIFVSYSPDGSFTERRFVSITVKQFKENNLVEDLWFDKDEQNTDSPSWFSQRMEAVERCRAAICFLSESYLQCPVSVYELRSLLERKKSSTGVPPKVFILRYENVELPSKYKDIVDQTVDLTSPSSLKLSLYERASTAIGALYQEIESCASVLTPFVPPTPPRDLTKDFKSKKLCRWSVNDVQSWLYDLGIKEFYCQCFLENFIDGFLLMSIMDHDLSECIGVDSRVARKKILQQIISILEKEHKMADNWHLRARTQRSRPDNIYLVYDPADVQLAQNLKQELKKKNLQVGYINFHHTVIFCFVLILSRFVY